MCPDNVHLWRKKSTILTLWAFLFPDGVVPSVQRTKGRGCWCCFPFAPALKPLLLTMMVRHGSLPRWGMWHLMISGRWRNLSGMFLVLLPVPAVQTLRPGLTGRMLTPGGLRASEWWCPHWWGWQKSPLNGGQIWFFVLSLQGKGAISAHPNNRIAGNFSPAAVSYGLHCKNAAKRAPQISKLNSHNESWTIQMTRVIVRHQMPTIIVFCGIALAPFTKRR